jgi:hypothetical protein
MPAMPQTQFNDMIASGQIDKYCVIRVMKHIPQFVQNKRYFTAPVIVNNCDAQIAARW